MSHTGNQEDRRQFGRRHTHLVGRVKVSGRGTLSCIVRNMSEGGALLVFDRPETVPFSFLLTIDGNNATKAFYTRIGAA